MSDVERVCARNWEQRRHAEDYEEEQKKIVRWEFDQYSYTAEQKEREREIRKMVAQIGKQAKTARRFGRMTLLMCGVSALMGLELLCPAFALISFIFYAFKMELDMEAEQVWELMEE